MDHGPLPLKAVREKLRRISDALAVLVNIGRWVGRVRRQGESDLGIVEQRFLVGLGVTRSC
jgi:hypothetical protein